MSDPGIRVPVSFRRFKKLPYSARLRLIQDGFAVRALQMGNATLTMLQVAPPLVRVRLRGHKTSQVYRFHYKEDSSYFSR